MIQDEQRCGEHLPILWATAASHEQEWIGSNSDHMTGSLQALLRNLIDYAGLYPPAALPLPQVLENYARYLDSPERWMLNRLVLPEARLGEVALAPDWHVTALADGEPGPLPPQVESLETRSAARLSLATYCEAPLDRIGNAFAKIRTGGLTPESVPSAEYLADFLVEAAARRMAFKATAGLHHPIRSATMHGFVNLFVSAAFAWHGEQREITRLLNEQDATAFQFREDRLNWRGRSLSTGQIAAARRDFAHSFGSCSFEEPIADLRQLGWIP